MTSPNLMGHGYVAIGATCSLPGLVGNRHTAIVSYSPTATTHCPPLGLIATDRRTVLLSRISFIALDPAFSRLLRWIWSIKLIQMFPGIFRVQDASERA